MEDGIFDERFREVNAGIDAEDEVLIAVLTKKTMLAASESEFAEEAFGIGETYGDWGKLPAEIAGVEVIKAGLDIGNGGNHEDVRRTNVQCTF